MEEERDDGPPSKKVAFGANANKFNIHSSLHSADFDDGDILKAKPIADLFPSTTVMFADIVGFTAWSSTRVSATWRIVPCSRPFCLTTFSSTVGTLFCVHPVGDTLQSL